MGDHGGALADHRGVPWKVPGCLGAWAWALGVLGLAWGGWAGLRLRSLQKAPATMMVMAVPPYFIPPPSQHPPPNWPAEQITPEGIEALRCSPHWTQGAMWAL